MEATQKKAQEFCLILRMVSTSLSYLIAGCFLGTIISFTSYHIVNLLLWNP